MLRYIAKRLLQAIPVLVGVTLVTYILIFAVGANPARLALGVRSDLATVESFQQEWGLDQPFHIQYLRFLGRTLRGDFGRSLQTNRLVLPAILERLPATATLALSALLFAIVFGIPIGVLSAYRPNSFGDNIAMSLAVLGISTPSFFLGILLAWIIGYSLGWTPISGYEPGVAGLPYLILPTIALGVWPLALFARLTRSSMLEVLGENYILTARAKGLSEGAVLIRHALKNALIPVVTTIGTSLAALLSGAFFIEYIFSWPGIGLLAVNAIQNYDIVLTQGCVMFFAIIFVLTNILVDIIYTCLNPRIRY